MSRGRSLNIRWGARWKPPKNVTTELRMLPGSYVTFEDFPLPYYSYVEHFIAGPDKSLICSKQYKYVEGEITTVAGKCLTCEHRDGSDAKNISWRVMHVWNAIHLAWYHLSPVLDDNDRPRHYEHGRHKGEVIMDKVLCEGRRCKLCGEKVEKAFGKKVHWAMGNSHLEQLGGIEREIGKDCTCGGRVTEIAYECGECGAMLLDITDVKPDEADTFGGTARKCPKCGKEDFPLKQNECNACQDPTPVTIFDCNIEVKRTGEKTGSTIQVPRWEKIELTEELKELTQPWPFRKIFEADPFSIQAKVLKIRNPYEDEEASSHAEDYSKDDAGAAAADDEIPF